MTYNRPNRHAWIINHYASLPWEPATRHFSLAQRMSTHGWDATIIACSAQHYTGAQRVSGFALQQDQTVENVRFRWVRLPRYKHNGAVRAFNMIAFSLLILAPWTTRGLQSPDIIIGSSVHPFAAWAAARLAKRHHVPFIFEIRDLWPETLIQLGAVTRTHPIARALSILEMQLCNQAVTIVTTMPYANEYLTRRGIPREKIQWITNGTDVCTFNDDMPQDNEPFTFIYYGTFGSANRLDLLVHGFARANLGDTVRLRLVGRGPRERNLVDLARELGVYHQVSIEPPISRKEIPALSATADCLVLALADSPLYEYGISLNKLADYMASTRPVLFAGSARGNAVTQTGGGVTCQPSPESIASAMRTITRAPLATRQAWSRANRTFAEENMDFENLTQRLVALLNDALKQHNGHQSHD